MGLDSVFINVSHKVVKYQFCIVIFNYDYEFLPNNRSLIILNHHTKMCSRFFFRFIKNFNEVLFLFH